MKEGASGLAVARKADHTLFIWDGKGGNTFGLAQSRRSG